MDKTLYGHSSQFSRYSFIIPLSLIIKVVYMLHGNHHSIFFKQQRIGYDGLTFNIFKFRTMIPNAE